MNYPPLKRWVVDTNPHSERRGGDQVLRVPVDDRG